MTALAPDNKIGQAAESLLDSALAGACSSLYRLAGQAAKRRLELGARGVFPNEFLDERELRELAATILEIIATADLLGRSEIRDREQTLLLRHQSTQESRSIKSSADVPIVKQTQPYYCGPAALSFALARWHVVKSQEELAQLLRTTPSEGTRPGMMGHVAGQLGLRAEVQDGLDVLDLAELTGNGIPVLCNVHMHGGGHWVTVTSATLDEITYLDPNDGRYHKCVSRDWMALWHDERDGKPIIRCGVAIWPRDYKPRAEEREPTAPDRPRNLLTDAPDIRQPNHFYCGAAAFFCCCRLFGVGPNTIYGCAKMLGTNVERSTHPFAIIQGAKALGLQVEAKEGMSLTELSACTERGWPVICPVQDYGGELPSEADFDYGHYLTVLKVIDGAVICQDSSIENLEREPGGDVPKDQAEQSGNIAMPGRIIVAWDTWDRGWHDQDIHGRKFIKYGIALGPPRRNESRRESTDGRTLLREALELRPIEPKPPLEALQFFRSLLPMLGVDPMRWLDDLRRRAFTLARATDDTMVERVQDFLSGLLETGAKISDAPHMVEKMLDQMGVTDFPGGYGSLIVRTNLMDAYGEGLQRELNQVRDTFPAWKYSAVMDSRVRPTHAAKNGRYYPSSVPFVTVRGTGPEDVCNCRCCMIPVDKWSWAELMAQGVKLEESW